MFFPPINLPLEPTPWAKAIQAALEKEKERGDRLERELAKLLQHNAASARQSNVVNIKASELTRTVESTAGLPPGGYRGAIVTQDIDGVPVWSTPTGSTVPVYRITLDSTGSSYEVNTFGAATSLTLAKRLLPEPLFVYGDPDPAVTYLDWAISWGNERQDWSDPALRSDPMPIQLEVYVVPRSEGERFYVELPFSWIGSGGAPWFTVVVYNDSEDYTADVEVGTDPLVYRGGLVRPNRMDLHANELFAWKADNDYFNGTANVEPFWITDAVSSGVFVQRPLDSFYWKNVRALEHDWQFSTDGDLVEMSGTHSLYNGRAVSVRVGKVVASVGTPSSGLDVQVQVLHNGTTPIFAVPLTIPAGENFAEKVPDAGGITLDPGYSYGFPPDEYVILLPGEFVTFEIVQVGSGAPGSDLTLQVCYG